MIKKITPLFFLASSLFFISATIDLSNLLDYENQSVPNYITKDNTPAANPITDEGATLGRVLFYDKNLSSNNTIACASCHQQEFAFSDTPIASTGWDGGTTGRHSMRLVNTRFSDEEKFFWDERAASLEHQTTEPIQDHVEMGFSGTNGDSDFDDLITKLEGLVYYTELFTLAYGDAIISEERIQNALAQFIRSIQSFDSKYDIGRAQVNNDNQDFPNFTAAENAGKQLFNDAPNNGGAGCNACHRAPEFDIDPNSNNNNIIGVIGDAGSTDLTNTRSPSLRDMVNPSGVLNGTLMHDGSLTSLAEVVDHYDDITIIPGNNQLDNRLRGGGGGGGATGQSLNLTATEKANLVAFLETMTGSDIYTAERYSDPFEPDGSITILNGILPVKLVDFDVKEENKTMVLDWVTQNERNNAGFEVQYSENAIDWTQIGFIQGAGESEEEMDYSFIHLDPIVGKNYYRLKQIDFDGKVDFSNVVIENLKGEDVTVQVSPNPVVDYLKVNLTEGEFEISIIDIQGRLLQQSSIENDMPIDFSGFESGIYFVRIENDKRVSEVVRVVKL